MAPPPHMHSHAPCTHAALKPSSLRPTAARRPAPPAPTTMASYSWSITWYSALPKARVKPCVKDTDRPFRDREASVPANFDSIATSTHATAGLRGGGRAPLRSKCAKMCGQKPQASQARERVVVLQEVAIFGRHAGSSACEIDCGHSATAGVSRCGSPSATASAMYRV